jgi:hypothetical protein
MEPHTVNACVKRSSQRSLKTAVANQLYSHFEDVIISVLKVVKVKKFLSHAWVQIRARWEPDICPCVPYDAHAYWHAIF